jgi:CubicO group peptidase (beta-lactamase class C family)
VVIEKATPSYDEAIRSHFSAPLGMNDTTLVAGSPPSDLA